MLAGRPGVIAPVFRWLLTVGALLWNRTPDPPQSGGAAQLDRFGNIVIDCTQRVSEAAERETELATPILMRVIGGAFSAIAKEMAGVLFRMSYSSIIRESEDLGAGIFDAQGRELDHAWFVGFAPAEDAKIVVAVMIEFGLNRTEYGKTVLAACFINDLGTVLALGFIFAPFTMKTLTFAVVAVVVFVVVAGSDRFPVE